MGHINARIPGQCQSFLHYIYLNQQDHTARNSNIPSGEEPLQCLQTFSDINDAENTHSTTGHEWELREYIL